MRVHTLAERLRATGGAVARWSLVLFFVGWGLYKFTPQEAAAVAPLTEHSALLFWVNRLLGERGGSNLIGVIEVTLGLMVATRHFAPRISAIGSLGTAFALLNTLSFLATTPGLDLQSADAGFLAKDLTLLGAALWSAGEALSASSLRDQRDFSAGSTLAPDVR